MRLHNINQDPGIFWAILEHQNQVASYFYVCLIPIQLLLVQVSDLREMALIEEKAETEMDEITLEPSQAEKTLEGQKPDK